MSGATIQIDDREDDGLSVRLDVTGDGKAARLGRSLTDLLAKKSGSRLHDSDCAVHNEPAYPAGPCDCGVELPEPLISYKATFATIKGYTAEQMREAILAERDRAARIAETAAYEGCHEWRRNACEEIAAAIKGAK
jgi:hypothetical protein